MKDLEELARGLQKGKKSTDFDMLMRTPEAKRIEATLDPRALENAVGRGDTEALRRMLGAVLDTPDGKKLAESVRKLMG